MVFDRPPREKIAIVTDLIDFPHGLQLPVTAGLQLQSVVPDIRLAVPVTHHSDKGSDRLVHVSLDMHPILTEISLEETDALRRQIQFAEAIRMLQCYDTLAGELPRGDVGDGHGRNQHHGKNRDNESKQQTLHCDS